MKKTAILLSLVLLSGVLFYAFRNREIPLTEEPEEHHVHSESQFADLSNESVQEESAKEPPSQERIVGLALAYMRVELPQPLNEPWRAAVMNSTSVFKDERSKEFALDVIPNWIRNALREGKREKAARFLHTLLLFVDDESSKISDIAMTELYRLGDLDDIALRKMQTRLKDETESYFYDDKDGHIGKRQQILNDLIFYDDRRLIDDVDALWRLQKEKNLKKTKRGYFPDFAFYLEQNGETLSLDYWHSRIDVNGNWENTYEILELKGNHETAQKLEEYFIDTADARKSSTAKEQRAVVAGLLFKLTGKAEYFDFVESKAQEIQTDYQAGSSEESRNILIAFAKTNPELALPLLENTRWKGQIRSFALDALAVIESEESSNIIVEEATRRITEDQRFPRDALESLIKQNTEYADRNYEELKQALLSNQYGRPASISDFDRLDFMRDSR